MLRDNNDGVRVTKVIYRSNLSYKLLKWYLEDLLDKGLVMSKSNIKGIRTYSVTDKGLEYLKDYTLIKCFV